MNKDVQISKITIKIGNKEAELTVEQAIELQEALTNLLGIQPEKETIYVDRPYVYPTYPTYPTYPYDWQKWEHVKIYPDITWTYTSGNAGGLVPRNYTIMVS